MRSLLTPARAPFARTLAAFTLTAVLVSGQLYIVIPLLHDMAADWGASAGGLTWLVTAFGIGYGAGFLAFGPLSDRYGRRRLLTIGLPLAALTSAAVALSANPEVALALRAVQGLAVAMFPPAALAYVAERVEPRRRVRGIHPAHVRPRDRHGAGGPRRTALGAGVPSRSYWPVRCRVTTGNLGSRRVRT
ncbi:MFS transporter [Nonomuraea sp. NPDC050153]|uniref:MFS transporter n=1 Tax=Nonomuraea sp. NPDC050153 TaxID=3364359 RepID=UPI0037BCA3EF